MTPSTFYLPDLERSSPFPLRDNLHHEPSASLSNEWIASYGIHPNKAHRIGFESCVFGLLVSYCYPRADKERFRVLCDFINSLFAFDDLMDEEHLVRDVHGTKAVMDIAMNALWHPETYQTDFQVGQSIQDFWGRAIKMGCAPGTQRRFLEYMDHYCRAVLEQVTNRSKNHIMDVESFTRMRRDTGALKICFVMGEFGLGLDLPDEVFEHPLIQTMENCSNDIVVLANDVYSWNIEQAQGHTANIITVLMNQKDIPVQEAMDIVGQEIQKRFQLYSLSKSQLPSWGTEVDKGVQAYATVLEDWTIGSIRWSLQSKRYFTKSAPYDPKTLEVKILPKEQKTATDLRTAKVKLSAVSKTAMVWGSIWVFWLLFTAIVVLHLAPHLLPTRSPVFSS
ncbi:hypothetical protein FRC00_011755 [Tulasnella sp. 408]|nr:hypothetical protein FRC00_011755 [Tulasnella sp. 408]